jgi:UDP-3-O-[3-hydroxymyristoyl] N-acetylglucosamine deacetylase
VTLQHQTTYTGVGIHSGETNTLTFHPAEIGTGIMFRHNGATFSPTAQSVVDTGRCTVIGIDNTRLATVEHLFSAFYGMQITDLLIETSGGPEVPIGDGSAKVWCELFLSAGLMGEAPTPQKLASPLLATGKNGDIVVAYSAEKLTITVAMHYDHPLIGTQVARWEGEDYPQQVAPARTFGLIEEVEQLQKMGLAKGGSLDNAIVVYPDHYSTP